MLRTLLIEDDANKLRSVAEALAATGEIENEGIVTAADAAAARRHLMNENFDLLVLDLVIPSWPGDTAAPVASERLLDDLFEGDELRMPGRIVGLTAFETLASTYAALFESRGVMLLRFAAGADGWRNSLAMIVRQIVARKKADANPSTAYATDVGIVCALPLELEAVERLGWDLRETTVPGDPALYLTGRFVGAGKERSIVACLCSRPGMSAASAATTRLISAFHPRFVVMPGITAAMRGRANIGDVIVADECWDWGMGKWTVQDGALTFVPGPHHVQLDADVRGKFVRLSRDTSLLARIRSSWPAEPPPTVLNLVIGPVASGAAVIAAQQMTDQIAAQQRKLVGIEMEAYGVYLAAGEGIAPRPLAVAIKAVSDFADEEKADRWQRYAAHTSAAVLADFVQTYT